MKQSLKKEVDYNRYRAEGIYFDIPSCVDRHDACIMVLAKLASLKVPIKSPVIVTAMHEDLTPGRYTEGPKYEVSEVVSVSYSVVML